jgi:pimeloyl-ACP methyl ester carboxylesterase
LTLASRTVSAVALGWLLVVSSGSTAAAASLGEQTVIREPVFQGRATVYEAGRQHKKSVVLIHGIGDNAALDWQALVPQLAREYRVLSFDLPGFGRSDKANVLYSPANYTAFVKHVVEKYVRGPYHVVGHSMGGAVALRYAASYPRDIDRLVLADVAGILHRSSYSQYLSHLGISLLPTYFPGQSEQIGKLIGQVLGKAERLNLDPELVIGNATMRQKVLQASPSKIAGLALVLDDFSELIPRVTAPTLIVWGRNDTIAPLRTGRLLQTTLPDAHLEILENSAHVPMQDNSDKFNSLVLGHLHASASASTPVPERTTPANATRNGRCERRQGMSFQGDYDRLVIRDCKNAVLRDVRVRRLEIFDSSVEIESSDVTDGLRIEDSTLTMTGGSIRGTVAITALSSRLDLAGVSITATELAVRAPLESDLIFSVCRVSSPQIQGGLHTYKVIGPRNSM